MASTAPRLLVSLALLGCLGVAGCQDSPDDEPVPDNKMTATPYNPDDSGAPVPDSASNETDPVAFGEAVWQAFFGNADLSKAEWWDQLEPLLSPAAAGVHQHTDPATFQPLEVTGTFEEAPAPPSRPGVTSEVRVPTSEGRYSLFLIRSRKTAPWRLEGIDFPRGAQQ